MSFSKQLGHGIRLGGLRFSALSLVRAIAGHTGLRTGNGFQKFLLSKVNSKFSLAQE
ncbi:MAG: hypothetical protein HC772_08865 [Leptolyngbyaceae cyanobacterium CRU_2_3]|nr:hypothetical protein [Leptolyngbyaceae cyanobacterium CRU_2_3]